jgi:hypothetical protein
MPKPELAPITTDAELLAKMTSATLGTVYLDDYRPCETIYLHRLGGWQIQIGGLFPFFLHPDGTVWRRTYFTYKRQADAMAAFNAWATRICAGESVRFIDTAN